MMSWAWLAWFSQSAPIGTCKMHYQLWAMPSLLTSHCLSDTLYYFYRRKYPFDITTRTIWQVWSALSCWWVFWMMLSWERRYNTRNIHGYSLHQNNGLFISWKWLVVVHNYAASLGRQYQVKVHFCLSRLPYTWQASRFQSITVKQKKGPHLKANIALT